jgi:hypothetical protein
MKENQPELPLSPLMVVRALSAIVALLLLAHIAGMVVTHFYPQRLLFGIYSLLDLSAEQNIPTLFSCCLFLMNALLFISVWWAGKRQGENQIIWLSFALLFIFLSIDEMSGLHERLMKPMQQAFHTSGLLYFAWVIPYGAGVVGLAAGVVPLWWRMERKIRLWFFLSGVTFVAGAIGMEMLGGASFDIIGKQDPDFVKGPLYQLLGTLEELLEMSGLIMLTYTLLSLLQSKYSGFAIVLPGSGESKTA